MNSQNGLNGTIECYAIHRTAKSEINKDKENGSATPPTPQQKKQNEVHEFQFGLGRWGTVIFLVVGHIAMTLTVISCTKDQCTVSQFPRLPREMTAYLDPQAFGIYFGWLLLQVVLEIICSGKSVEGKLLRNGQRLQYQLKGFKICVINIVIIMGLEMSSIKLHVYNLADKMLAFYFAATFTSVVIAAVLYLSAVSRSLTSSQINSLALSGDVLHDAFVGREINPRFLNVDVKAFLLRLSQHSMVAFNSLLLLKELEKSTENRSPLLLFIPIFQIFYAIENLFFEETETINRTCASEGVGYKNVYGNLVLIAFVAILPIQHNIIHHTPYNETMVIFVFFVWLIGYLMYRLSKAEKRTFYWYPNHEDFAEMEIVPCENGENLLVGGWWGWVRHPNYLGLIIVTAANGMLAGFDDILIYAAPILFTVYFIHRIYYEEKRSRAKYGKGWDRYCEKVPYRLLKYIF